MDFAAKVRHMLSLTEWTQAETAVRCGWGAENKGRVSALIKSKGKATPDTIAALSMGFNMPKDYWTITNPREYLSAYLRSHPGAAEEFQTKAPRSRLGQLLNELDRVWPGHNILSGLTLTTSEELATFLHGESELVDSQLEEISLALGLDASFLDTYPVHIDPSERHQYQRIISLAKHMGVSAQELLDVVAAVGLAKVAGVAIPDLITVIRRQLDNK